MAERRMFAKTIIDSDAFLEMPVTTQLLYFHLSMRADDDGFINKPKSIMRMIGCKDDDMKILIGKKFIIPFESGVVVIKHWKIHNYIRKDTYTKTKYQEELSELETDENSAYRIAEVFPLQLRDESVTGSSTQVRLGKDRLGKDSNKGRTKFVPPTVEEVKAYCLERKNGIDPQAFVDHYTANNWMRGKTKISDWKACVRTWENRRKEEKPVKEKSSGVEAMEKDIEFRFAKIMQEYGDVK